MKKSIVLFWIMFLLASCFSWGDIEKENGATEREENITVWDSPVQLQEDVGPID